jgi:hypothetical protein
MKAQKEINLFFILLSFGALMLLAGWGISKTHEYRKGVRDGMNATMLIDTSKLPCEITYEIRRVKEFK